jgi:hypothetical protein
MSTNYIDEMISAYKTLCYDGQFDIAFSILERYNLLSVPDAEISAFHSKNIIMFDDGKTHYDYCREHNIDIEYWDINISPYTSVFSRIPPHPEMVTMELDIIHKLHILFPNKENRRGYTPPSDVTPCISGSNIKQLQTILKDELVFTADEIFDNKDLINNATMMFDFQAFFIYLIKNKDFDPDTVFRIVQEFQYSNHHDDYPRYNSDILDYRAFISVIVIHNNKQHMRLLNYFLDVMRYDITIYDMINTGRLIPHKWFPPPIEYTNLKSRIKSKIFL